jgi:C4-dicarboxylate-specific signal transduction histidine kinase
MTDVPRILILEDVATDGSQIGQFIEQRRAKEALRHSEAQLEAQKLEAIGRLTSGLAHDFNTLGRGQRGSGERV